jgi:hypothetical protein
MGQFEIQWEAPEFERRPKDISWYWLSIVFAIIILGIAIWQKNFLFGFFIIIAEILLLVWGGREPNLIKFAISDKGLTINNRKFYPLKEFAGFCLEEINEEEWSMILFRFRRRFSALCQVMVPKALGAEIKKYLVEAAIPEIELEESFIGTLQKFFRF